MADALLNVSPGLIIWTLVNFGIFFFLIAKFGFKPMIASLEDRETSISNAISEAERLNAEAQKLFRDSQEKLGAAQHEMMELVKQGKVQAESIIRSAQEQAEKVKKDKIDQAVREIEREKEQAIQSLRSEMATLVVTATSKLLGSSLDEEKHKALVNQYIDQVSRN